MKNLNLQLQKIIFSLVFILATFAYGHATIHTVDNQPNSGAQFSGLQEAIDAAAGGDTIYVAGSPTTYGNITVNKKLAIIGAGYKVDNQWGLATTVGSISLRRKLDEFDNVQSNASGSYFSGFNFSTLSKETNRAFDGIIVDRCRFTILSANSSDTGRLSIAIRNSVFERVTLASSSGTSALVNLTVSNSILDDRGSSFGLVSSSNSASNVLFNNCIFKGSELEGYPLAYVVFTNCIMFNALTSNADFCTFTNNISYSTNPAAPASETAFVYGTNTGENNIVNTDPLFQNIESGTFSFLDDFRLQDGSPGIGAGSDGTDIGLYGGNFPFPVGGEGEFLMAAPPKIPQIYEMNVQNATLPENGTLNVRVKARKQN